MAASQISTSVTIINSLLGFQALSLSAMGTSSAPDIKAGSKVEIASAFFTFETDSTPQADTWTPITTGGTAYITLTATGVAGSQTLVTRWSSDAPTWSDSKQGWYDSTATSVIRYVAGCEKDGDLVYASKFMLPAYLSEGFVFPIFGAANQDAVIRFASDASLTWDESEDLYVLNKALRASAGGLREPNIFHGGVETEEDIWDAISSFLPANGAKLRANGVIDGYGISYIERDSASQFTIYGAIAGGTCLGTTIVEDNGGVHVISVAW